MAKASEDFELLNKTATPMQQREWQDQLDQAHEARASDVTAMDVLDVKIQKGRLIFNLAAHGASCSYPL